MAMEPVSLIVGALAAGAVKGVGETAAAAVKDAYEGLKAAVAARFADKPTAEVVLAAHVQDPDTYDKPLAKHLSETGADTDPRIVQLAQTLMGLLDEQGAAAGKYRVDLRDAQGVQVGDHNTQTNTFS
jgi:hypothetical protein